MLWVAGGWVGGEIEEEEEHSYSVGGWVGGWLTDLQGPRGRGRWVVESSSSSSSSLPNPHRYS